MTRTATPWNKKEAPGTLLPGGFSFEGRTQTNWPPHSWRLPNRTHARRGVNSDSPARRQRWKGHQHRSRPPVSVLHWRSPTCQSDRLFPGEDFKLPFAAYNSDGVRLLSGVLADAMISARKTIRHQLSEAEASELNRRLVRGLHGSPRLRRARSRCAEARGSSIGPRMAGQELSASPETNRPASRPRLSLA